MISTDFYANCITGKSGSRNLAEMIIEPSKTQRCMMHKVDKFLALEVTDTLVLPKISLESRIYIKDKYPLLLSALLRKSGKASTKIILEINKLLIKNFWRKKGCKRRLREKDN